MQTFTPVRATPHTTHSAAAAALQALIDSSTALSTELQQLPGAHQALLDALGTENNNHIEAQIAELLGRIDDYWQGQSASGHGRRQLLAVSLKEALRDEAVLKSHEGELLADATLQLASVADEDAQGQATATYSSLHVRFNELSQVEIKGALVIGTETGRTMLALPGTGLTEFPTQDAMIKAVVDWLNDDELRWALLINADLRHQGEMSSIAEDPDLSVETFEMIDVQLQAIDENPYVHAVMRQLHKQREDVRYTCGEGLSADPLKQAAQIDGAIRMSGLFGPSRMLQLREQAVIERKMRTALPHWIKCATPESLAEYMQLRKRHEQATIVLTSALNGAACADEYAQVSVRSKLANDLGYDLEPDDVIITTGRTLPITGETYTVTSNLRQLALYGLYPDDRQDGSDFLTRSTVTIDEVPAATVNPLLTPAYIAEMIDELQLRTTFGDYQRATYAKTANQKLMCDLIRLQIAEMACVAKMQGHILVDDFHSIQAIAASAPTEDDCATSVHQIRIDNSEILGRILVFRKQSPQGELERLIMFTCDAPRNQLFQSFQNQNQLLHELVGWTDDEQMRDYLLNQVKAPCRPALEKTLLALKQKPHPASDFIQLVPMDSYDIALQQFVSEHISVTLSDHQSHTPDWFLRGSQTSRQHLMATEQAIGEAVKLYQAKTHTQVQDFEDYVYERASEKICQLLNVEIGTVDPDQIVITSERETLTYTSMIRNGYDDSLGFLNPSADTMATFSGPDGVDLSALTPQLVAGSVRGKWLADDYVALIRRTLLASDSEGYEYRRQSKLLITQLQMQASALRSLMQGHISDNQYQWLERVIGNVHRDDHSLRSRYPIYPLKIHVDKPLIASGLQLFDQLVVSNTALTHVETVQGCFILLSNESRQAPLLYTPNASDGIEFRLFSTFTESLDQPGMIDYYKDRCRVKAQRVMSFFLNDMKQGNDKAPSVPKESIKDFAEVCFNRPIERKLRDVEETTTGRKDMLSKVIWDSIDIVTTVLTLPFPPASFLVGVALSLRDNFKAIQALTGETPEEANALIFASVANIAGAAGDFKVGIKGFGGLLRMLGKKPKKVARATALKKPSNWVKQEKLYPINLQDETYYIGKPNANGQAAVYENAAFVPDEVYPTGHYATRGEDGAWRPFGQPSAPTPSMGPGTISADRVVDISVQDLPRITEGHAKGVSLGNGKSYIQMNDLVYQVQYDARVRCWHIVDPENPFAFFGRQPVRLNEQDQWTLVERSGLRGGGNVEQGGFRPLQDEQAAAETASHLHQYELPSEIQPYIKGVLDPDAMGNLGMGLDELFEELYAQMREKYAALRENLYRDADAFFAQPVTIPPRPAVPAIDSSTTVSSFLESAFASSNGLILSEAPKAIASKRLLIMNMQTLAEQRIEVIYLPHLFTDKHASKLAKYRAKGQNVRSGSHEIKHHLKDLNGGALDNLSQDYDYYHLIKQAHRHGIEVRPLSSSVSYPIDAHPVLTAAGDSNAAQKMSNFFSHKVISADTAADPSKRWIALVDQKMATTHDQIPGMAEMEGVISLHIEEVPAGQPTRISQNTRRTATAGQSPCDFNIQFANAPAPELQPAVSLATAPAPTPAGTSATMTFDEFLARATTPDAQTISKVRGSDVGFRWDDTSGWQRVAPENWVDEVQPSALQLSLVDASYEMPIQSRAALIELAYFQRKGLDSDYFTMVENLIPAQNQFFELRAKLHREAQRILSIELPPRPVMPSIDPQPSTEAFIQSVYRQMDGMVVGEFHASVGSKKFIIDNLPLLAEQNVKTLYMEHLLTDVHQMDLDRFFETGNMSKTLLDGLRTLDKGHLTDPTQVYNFEKLVINAQRNGIEIRAIDCAASYHLKGIRQTPTTRQQMMNFFASRTIRRHQEVIGKHKWIALVGNTHCNTYNKVPGLAELEGALGVRINDVAPGTSAAITLDAGETASHPLKRQEGFIRGDFKVEVEVTRTPAVIKAPRPLSVEQRLCRPGFFVAKREHGVNVIIHRSRDKAIHRTTVQIDAAGKVFIDRPTWTAVHLQPYEDMNALIRALEDINLTRVG